MGRLLFEDLYAEGKKGSARHGSFGTRLASAEVSRCGEEDSYDRDDLKTLTEDSLDGICEQRDLRHDLAFVTKSGQHGMKSDSAFRTEDFSAPVSSWITEEDPPL